MDNTANLARLRTFEHQTLRQGLITVRIHSYTALIRHATDENNPIIPEIVPQPLQDITPMVMNNPLNFAEVTTYAQRLAAMVCNQFYRQNTVVNGKQIVELTENKQINFFIIKALFLRWQEEMTHLRSPYFDYTNAEVNKTLHSLMNLLSQNIAVARKDFEPLLVEAIKDSIVLALAPKEYYQQLFGQYGEDFNVATQFKALAKYIKTHKALYDRLLAYLEREANPTIRTQRAEVLLEGALKEISLTDESKELLGYFAKLLPVKPDYFFLKEEDNIFNIGTSKKVEETTNFFDSLLSPEPPPTTKEQPIIVEQQKPTYESITAIKAEPVPVLKTEKSEVFSFNQQFQQEYTAPVYTNLNQQVAQEKQEQEESTSTSLNESIGKNQKLSSLRESIPLNKKFAFINVLFNGDTSEFENAVEMIDQCNDYHKAIMLIKEKYFRRYGWDLEKEEVKEFYELVSRKF